MTEILHFDTYLDNCTYFKNSPYDTIFKLSNPVKCIHKIYLKSLEMPIVFENIRDGNTSNVFSIKINNTIKTATLASKNYTDINVLLTDINNALGYSYLSVNSNGYIILSATINSNIVIQKSILANVILGFSENQSGVTSLSSTNKYTLSYDNFISLYLDIPSKGTSSGSRLISFKIPLNAVNGMIFYMADNASFRQYIEVADENYVLSQFRVTVYDRFGYNINTGLDYSFTLELQFCY